MFTLWGGAIYWRSVKQVGIANSTMETGSIAALEAAVQAKWLSSFLMDNSLVPSVQSAIIVIIAERLKVRRNLVSMRRKSHKGEELSFWRDSKERRQKQNHFASEDALADPISLEKGKGVICIATCLRV